MKDCASKRDELRVVRELFQQIVRREWAPPDREPLRRLVPDARYSCVAPFWI